MNILIIVGILLTLLGLCTLGYCVVQVVRARRQGLSAAEFSLQLRRLIGINMCALFLSALGLGMVSIGILMQL